MSRGIDNLRTQKDEAYQNIIKEIDNPALIENLNKLDMIVDTCISFIENSNCACIPKEFEELIPNIGECGESVWIKWYECSICGEKLELGQQHCSYCNKIVDWENLIKLDV